MYYKSFTFDDEEWKIITNREIKNITPNKYIASNYGYISNINYNQHGMVYSLKYGGQFNNRAYVNIIDIDGHNILALVSRIVAKLFCPGYLEGLQVNHIDGNPRNNYYRNLEWCTREENIRHAYNNNLIQSLINEEIVRNICMLLEEDKLSAYEIADITGLNEISSNPIALISAIKKKKLWVHISNEYNIPIGRHGRIFSDIQIMKICELFEKDITISTENILNCIGIMPSTKEDLHLYTSTISAIRNHRKYLNISSNYSF